MRKWFAFVVVVLLFVPGMSGFTGFSTADPGHWPHWRGPLLNGIARTGAPTEFSDTKNVKWKVAIPGRVFSTPVIWGDRIFLTTAVPTGKTVTPPSAPQSSPQPAAQPANPQPAAQSANPQQPGGQRPGRGGGGGPGGGA